MLYEIGAQLCMTLEVFLILISTFLTERYVFLEPALEKKRQRGFYAVCFVVVFLVNLLDSKDLATYITLFFGGWNVYLARKEHRVRGFFLIIPITGIINGFVVPILILPTILFSLTEKQMMVYSLFIYGIAYYLLILFFFKGKKWRQNFLEEMETRCLQKWERFMLYAVGVLLLGYSSSLTGIPTVSGQYQVLADLIAKQIVQMGITSLFLTVTVIVLILQGNKRSYYYEKTLNLNKVEMEREKAEAANEAKSAFLSNMSHEIRTPMNAIVGMTDILLRENHPPKTREYLNNIKNSGAALLTIINDILDFSKIESGKMEIVEEEYEPMSMLNDLSMIFLNRIGEKRVELLYDIDKKLPRKLSGDGQRLRQIIINLMNNAIKFTESGYVRLSVKTQMADEEHMELTFTVEDTGQGIKEEDMEKLFGSFQQVDTKKNHYKEGTGLGLAISKQLVELMHGSIGVESKYGKGSTFYFTVPQKIIDAREAAVLKTEPGKKDRIGMKVTNTLVREQLKRLADSYQVEWVDLDEMPEQDVKLGQGVKSGQDMASEQSVASEQEATSKMDVTFLITDDEHAWSEEERSGLKAAGVTLCLLQNPMVENHSGKNMTILNKPLYSLNFCQLLNHEELIFRSMAEEQMHFIAPQASILVVDDNEMNLKVACGLLEPFQMQIDTACNGKEALQMVQKKAYDMVFMDHMMPVMDGIEATRAIRGLEDEVYRKLPIIALSANATAEAREMFLRENLDDFVAKPIKFKEISKCILKWLPKELVIMTTPETQALQVLGAEVSVSETSVLDIPAVEMSASKEEALPEIEGLDVAEGIKNCGSKKLFMELLGDFYKLIEPKSIKLEKCLADGMLRDYTIEVHALKNTARMIGAMELSQLFYRMEQLGNAGEQEQIEAQNPEVLALYRSYKPILEKYGRAAKDEQAKVSAEQMQQTLMRLHDAMDNFDLDEADAAMKELETYAFPADMQPMVEQLSAFVSDVAMEEVLQITEAMCERLKAQPSNEWNEADDADNIENTTTGALVLIVDDDEINTKAVTGMLREEYRVVSAKSGTEALEVLKQQMPDLILLDVHMPKMSGHEVLRLLKEEPDYSEIPVIFLTSDEDEKTEVQGFSEGAIDFIKKPLKKAVAIQRIRRILELSYLQKNLKQEVEKQTDVAERRREKVERMSMQMVHALANTIDAKDSYTNGHSTRVAQYSVMLAKRMGYADEKLERLHYAALLHDIGKIGVPREIINKPSKLTDEEYEIIKTHPGIGGNILDEISEIPDIAIGARWHHERYDGKGYPDGLKGMEIPEIARIIGVADAYDAMTSKRSYRDVLPQEVVSKELEKGKESQFDPQIAELMIQLMKEDTDYKMHE